MGSIDNKVEISKSGVSVQRKVVIQRFNSEHNSLEKRITEYCGTDIMTDDGVELRDALYICFSLQGAVMESLEGRFIKDDKRLFTSMYGFYIGAIEALHEINGRQEDSGVHVRNQDTVGAFDGFNMNVTNHHPHQYYQYMNLMTKALSNPRIRDRKGIGQLGKEFFELIRDSAFKVLTTKYFAPSMEQLKSLELHYNGKVVKGMEIGITMMDSGNGGWERIAGYEEQKGYFQRLQRRIAHLEECIERKEDIFHLLPNTILYGPPGTGKTRMAKTFASQAGIPFYAVNITHLADTFKDGSGKRLQKKFNEATAPLRKGITQASLMYIDEMNAITRARFQQGSSREDDKTVDTFLLNSGSENQVPGLIIVGSTNAINVFSDTVLSRFPSIIELPEPGIDTQAKIIKYFTQVYNGKKNPRFDAIDYTKLAKGCVHPDGRRFVARDIESLFGIMIREVSDHRIEGKDYRAGTDDFIEQARRYAAAKDTRGKVNHS